MFKKTLYVLALTSVSGIAMASGFQISEYSAAGLGRSFAGAGVVGDDFSAIAYNPAGMQFNKTNGVQGGATAINLYGDYRDNDTTQTGSMSAWRVLPHVFTQYKLNDKMTLGAGIYTPYGLIIDYDNAWAQGKHGILSELKGVDLSVGASYQIHKMVAFGASVNGQYADARLTSANAGVSNDLRGKDMSLGYTVGMTFMPTSKARLGVSYRSKVDHKLEGKVKVGGAPVAALNGKADVTAKITTPDLVLFSAAYDIHPQWTISAAARWTKWSRFKNLDIKTAGPMNAFIGGTIVQLPEGSVISSTHENWKNAWFYSLGADYRINDTWTVRFGGAYDETVIKDPSYRTVRIPDGRRWFASVGASYTKDRLTIDTGYLQVWMRSNDAKGGETGKTPADVHYNDAGAHMFSISAQYAF